MSIGRKLDEVSTHNHETAESCATAVRVLGKLQLLPCRWASSRLTPFSRSLVF
jgi:hypothetical protein